jgi:single-strand DNA-binding protein
MTARVTIVGNLTKDPAQTTSQRGDAITKFDVAVNRPTREGAPEEQPSYFNVTCFGTLALNTGQSLHKGNRVIVEGNLDVRIVGRDDGSKATFVNVVADSVGLELRFHTGDVQPGRQSMQGGDRPGPANQQRDRSREQRLPRPAADQPRNRYEFDEEPF